MTAGNAARTRLADYFRIAPLDACYAYGEYCAAYGMKDMCWTTGEFTEVLRDDIWYMIGRYGATIGSLDPDMPFVLCYRGRDLQSLSEDEMGEYVAGAVLYDESFAKALAGGELHLPRLVKESLKVVLASKSAKREPSRKPAKKRAATARRPRA